MASFERIQSLRTKHKNLDVKIHEEMKRPLPDNCTLTALKREKLRIKEELDHLQHQ